MGRIPRVRAVPGAVRVCPQGGGKDAISTSTTSENKTLGVGTACADTGTCSEGLVAFAAVTGC